MKECLIVIDMQNDFITGSLGSNEAETIVPKVKARIEEAINKNEDIYFTKDTHLEPYEKTREGQYLPIKHCMEGTKCHDICDELKPYEKNAKKIIIKYTFGSTELPTYLKEYDKITFVGLCTDICVVSNVLLTKAFYPEKPIVVEKDLCAGTSIENHQSALNVMKSCHIDII